MDAKMAAYPFQMSGSFGELDDLRSLLGYQQQQSNGYSTSFAGLDSFDNNASSGHMLLASALQSKKLAEAKSTSQYFAGSCDNLASFSGGNQFMPSHLNPYSVQSQSKCFYRPQSFAEPDAKSFFSLSSPSSSLSSSSNSSSSCFQSNMTMIFDELLGDSNYASKPMSNSSYQAPSQLTLSLPKSSNDRTVLSANINHANIQSKPAAETKKEPEIKESQGANCDDPTDLLNALLDKALLSIYDDENSCEELLIAAFDHEHDSNQKVVSENQKVANVTNSIRSNGTSPAFSPMSSTGTGPSRAVPSPSYSKSVGSNPHSAPYRQREDAAGDSNSLMLYRSVNTSNTIFVQPTDVLEPLNEGEFTEYKLFPSNTTTKHQHSSSKPPPPVTPSSSSSSVTMATWSSVKQQHSKSCLPADMELLVIDYTPPFSVSLSPNTSSSSSCSNGSSLLTSPSISSPSKHHHQHQQQQQQKTATRSPYLTSNPYSATIF